MAKNFATATALDTLQNLIAVESRITSLLYDTDEDKLEPLIEMMQEVAYAVNNVAQLALYSVSATKKDEG